MKYTEHDFIIIFATTRSFIKGLNATKHIPHEVKNTPRELYNQCGSCLFFSSEFRDVVEKILPPDADDLIYIDTL